MQVKALCVKVEYMWLEWGHLTRGSAPDCCELVAPMVLVPNVAPDGKDVEYGDTEVGKCINGATGICKLHADGEVHTAAQRNHFRVEQPDDSTLFQIGECMVCHPLDRDSFDLHVLECVDKLEVSLNRIGGEAPAHMPRSNKQVPQETYSTHACRDAEVTDLIALLLPACDQDQIATERVTCPLVCHHQTTSTTYLCAACMPHLLTLPLHPPLQ